MKFIISISTLVLLYGLWKASDWPMQSYEDAQRACWIVFLGVAGIITALIKLGWKR